MQILKFGGSSVATADAIKQVATIVKKESKKDKTVVVVSALGKITDALLECGITASEGKTSYEDILQNIIKRHGEVISQLIPAKDSDFVFGSISNDLEDLKEIFKGIFILKEFSPRIRDKIAAYGEILSSKIISSYLSATGINNVWLDAREFIKTDSCFTKANVDYSITNEKIIDQFNHREELVYLVPGFIASDKNHHTTTLGRGGSDFTAAIIASALKASVCQIWTDVPGMMTADPKLVPHAKANPHISFHEAMELSHFGAKVIYPPTLQPLLKAGIPVLIKNTFQPDAPGTYIETSTPISGSIISGISSITNISLMSLEGSGMIGIPGFSKRLFEVLADSNVNVILITQASSEHSICVGIDASNTEQAKAVVDFEFSSEIHRGLIHPLIVEQGLSIIALVGDGMKNHTGLSGKMFSSLGRNGINIRAIAQGSSERNISAVISSEDVRKAINILHEEFFETTYKQVNLFIAGIGNVGSKLLQQLHQQNEYLLKNLKLQLRVIGIANSRQMLFKDEGIDIKNAGAEIQNGESMNIEKFISEIQKKNLRNSIFVDVTANENVASVYEKCFEKSISVVACNKIASSSTYKQYQKLKALASEHNASFLFETNVGAGLPVIGTLNDLLQSGDSIISIKAVLSGTLNFVFNNYDGTRPFAQVVKQAQDEGYTEPDPRLDLSGMDVMRKIMILAREAGENMEMDDIVNHSFMPPSCMQGSVEDFYAEMEKHEAHFRELLKGAEKEGSKLKFVASYQSGKNGAPGKAFVGLEKIDPQHDFYHLYGKDNIVLFQTKRYMDQPMVVKGAGAGADVTASGVFADIIRAARI